MDNDLQRLVDALDDIGIQLFALLTRITLSEDVAEELLQELVLKFVRSPDLLQGIDNLGGYLHRSAMRLAFNWRRDQRTRQTSPLPPELPDATLHPSSHSIDQRELHETVLRAIGDLPSANREVVMMRFLQEQSYEDISDQLNKTPHLVRSLCSKGVQMLRSKLRHLQSDSTYRG